MATLTLHRTGRQAARIERLAVLCCAVQLPDIRQRQHQFSPSTTLASRSRSVGVPPRRRTVVKSAALGRAGVDGGFFLHAPSVLFFASARSATARNYVEEPQ
jgi:hypothetical protein